MIKQFGRHFVRDEHAFELVDEKGKGGEGAEDAGGDTVAIFILWNEELR